jgi:hypothetical protein
MSACIAATSCVCRKQGSVIQASYWTIFRRDDLNHSRGSRWHLAYLQIGRCKEPQSSLATEYIGPMVTLRLGAVSFYERLNIGIIRALNCVHSGCDPTVSWIPYQRKVSKHTIPHYVLLVGLGLSLDTFSHLHGKGI